MSDDNQGVSLPELKQAITAAARMPMSFNVARLRAETDPTDPRIVEQVREIGREQLRQEIAKASDPAKRMLLASMLLETA